MCDVKDRSPLFQPRIVLFNNDSLVDALFAHARQKRVVRELLFRHTIEKMQFNHVLTVIHAEARDEFMTTFEQPERHSCSPEANTGISPDKTFFLTNSGSPQCKRCALKLP